MSDGPWEVWVGESSYAPRFEASFKTLDAAEKYAKSAVRLNGNSREIRQSRLVASVRRDALYRVWVDVLDGALA